MSTGLQARTTLKIQSGGYSGEATGSSGGYSSYTDVGLNGSVTASYWFTDSDRADNNNSSRVTVTIRSEWTATTNPSTNKITINLVEYLTKIVRGNVVGNPKTVLGVRSMRIQKKKGGATIWNVERDNITTSHTIFSGSTEIDSKTIVLGPDGDTAKDDMVYMISWAPGYWKGTLPSKYADAMTLGIQFKNSLPANYIPGKVYDGSEWVSHNRVNYDGINGTARIYTSPTSTRVMRTINGAVGQNDAPYIQHSASEKYNMRRIGAE